MMKKIMKFEIFYNFKRPFTYLFFVMLLAQGIWYSAGINDYYSESNTLMNAPVLMYQNLAGMGMILIIIVAIISAGALARDLEFKTAETIYSSPLNEKRFFIGKYFGVLLVNLIVVLGYPLGMLLLPYTGIGMPEQFGPVPWGQMVHGFVISTLPNLILLVTFSIFLVIFFRKTAAAYVGVLFVMMAFITSVALREQSSYPFFTQLLDPFGYSIVVNISDNMSLVERNTAYLPVNHVFLLNRLVWLSVSIIMFIASFLRFDFKYFIALPSKKKVMLEEKPEKLYVRNNKIIALTPVFTSASLFGKSFRFAWMDFKSMTRSVVFRIVLVFLFLMFLGYNFLWTSEYYITTSHLPITSVMTFVRAPMMVMILVMILIFSGELLFKDRKSGVWQITDAMPTPSWVFILSRFITLAGVAFIISTLLLAAGLVAQLSAGFTDIEWGLYFKDLYTARFGWITSLHIICMAFFLGSLFSNRLKGHVISIGIFIFLVISLEFKLIEQLCFTFPFAPGVEDYSEMNGYGVFDAALPWYGGAWSALAVVFILLTVLFWNRGTDRTWKERRKVVTQRLNRVNGSALVLFFCLFAGFQCGIYDNVIQKAGFQTSDQKEAEAADYERKYIKYAETAQPKITDLNLKLDLYPEKRKAVYKAGLLLQNKSSRPIDTMHVDWKNFLTIKSIRSENKKLEIAENDETLRHSIYQLSKPLQSGDSMKLTVDGELHYKGFHQSDPQADLTFNGTFLGTDLLPYFGYDEGRELDNPRDRLKQGLALIESRMDGADNLFSRSNAVQSDQADLLTWNIIVSTSGSQEVAGPGEQIKTWKENGRNYFQYQSEMPGYMNFKLISACFNKKEFSSGKTRVSIYYHPDHTYNIKCFQEAAEKAMLWLSEKSGEYPYSCLRIVEKPFYDEDFVTFNNVTAISEKHGWTADISKSEDVQYIYYVVVRELAKQWVQARVPAANVQGAEVFTESIPEYYALTFMDDYFGHAQAAKWLNENFKDYQEGKGEEAIVEHVLLNVDKALYVSREKGGLALYALAQQIGKEKFNKWLRKWLDESLQKAKTGFITSLDFYSDLKKELPVSLHPVTEEWFKQRTQYQISLSHASMKNDIITLEISATRGILDSIGNLTEKPIASLLEVGFVNENGELIETNKIRIKSGAHTYNLHSSFKPDKVILDPYYWYLIGNRKKGLRQLEF